MEGVFLLDEMKKKKNKNKNVFLLQQKMNRMEYVILFTNAFDEMSDKVLLSSSHC